MWYEQRLPHGLWLPLQGLARESLYSGREKKNGREREISICNAEEEEESHPSAGGVGGGVLLLLECYALLDLYFAFVLPRGVLHPTTSSAVPGSI